MEPASNPKRTASRWIAVGACLFLGAGLGFAARAWRKPPNAVSPRSNPAVTVDTLADPIPRALNQAGPEDEKSRWVDDLTEVDLAALDETRREIFLRQVNTRRCTCGCGYTLAACRIYDSTCEKSLPRVRAVFDSVASGVIADATGLRQRPSGSSHR